MRLLIKKSRLVDYVINRSRELDLIDILQAETMTENLGDIIKTDNFLSKGKNNLFDGQEVYSKIIMTVRKGKIMYQQGV